MSKKIKLIIQLLLTIGIACFPTLTRSSFAQRAKNEEPKPHSKRQAAVSSPILFDDFSYSNDRQLARHGWIIRTATGWPGIPGATWGKTGVSSIEDAEHPGNLLLRMISSTDGTGANTFHTQICHQRKYLEGTYAARVRFFDLPNDGPDGDVVVETFYTISPLKGPWDPDYSELDFEYLPNGGWGTDGPTLYTTSWRTFSPPPNWKKDNVFNASAGTIAGWHTLVTRVSEGKVAYFIDGKPLAEHSGQYYPRSLMSINFNLWFTTDSNVKSNLVRHYQEDIDWVFHEAKKALTPEEVEAKVASLRRRSRKYQDTVPAPVPALISPCDY